MTQHPPPPSVVIAGDGMIHYASEFHSLDCSLGTRVLCTLQYTSENPPGTYVSVLHRRCPDHHCNPPRYVGVSAPAPCGGARTGWVAAITWIGWPAAARDPTELVLDDSEIEWMTADDPPGTHHAWYERWLRNPYRAPDEISCCVTRSILPAPRSTGCRSIWCTAWMQGKTICWENNANVKVMTKKCISA